jgi:hypothetical protein
MITGSVERIRQLHNAFWTECDTQAASFAALRIHDNASPNHLNLQSVNELVNIVGSDLWTGRAEVQTLHNCLTLCAQFCIVERTYASSAYLGGIRCVGALRQRAKVDDVA